MPGHKLGRGFVQDCAFDNVAQLDVTELDVTDDLHSPHGPLLEAQLLAAQAFGAGKTWFLVNGSSCGIFAMITATCGSGGKLLMARDFHYSALNAIRFARAIPVYIPLTCTLKKPDVPCGSVAPDRLNAPYRSRISHGVESILAPDRLSVPYGSSILYNVESILTPDSVERALFDHIDAAALYLTRPGYYGSVCDITEITRLAHRRGIPVLVDEAHGAHLSFSNRLPAGALEGGADYCVQSAHKTLPAFTQCAYLHASERAAVDNVETVERISEALRVFQTSSPSFVLTASLDYAREYMSQRGASELDRVLNNCELFYTEMAAAGYGIPGDISPREERSLSYNNSDIYSNIHGATSPIKKYGRDMTRLVLATQPIGLSGVEVAKRLWSDYRISIEMSDPYQIVMITTVADRDEDFSLLKAALSEIALKQNKKSESVNKFTQKPQLNVTSNIKSDDKIDPVSDTIKPIYTAPDFIRDLHTLRRYVPFITASGCISADIVTPYPPGIPLLCPGEVISGDIIEEIRLLLDAGVQVKGISPGDMAIAIIDDNAG